MLKLVVADHCPFCHRCLLVLLEKRISFESVEIDLTKKDGIRHLLSPYGRVPVLWHNEHPIFESSIINEYLEDNYPTPPLLPEAPHLRATTRFWIDFCNTRFMPAYFNLLKEQDTARRAALGNALTQHLKFIETVGLSADRAAGPYWMGAQVTLADYAFYPFFERFASVEVYRGTNIPDDCRHLRAWLDAMSEREAVRRLARSRAHYVEYYKMYYADQEQRPA